MPDSPVINDSDDFVPMPTPDQVVEGEAVKRLDPLPFEFSDIRALAQKILKRAQEQGMQKIEAARKQVATMEKAAHDKAYAEAFPKGEQEGFAKGEKDGMAAAETKIAAAVESEKESFKQNAQPVTGVLEQLASILHENRQQLMAQAEADLLLLALDLAKRLVGHELSVDPEAVRPLAVEAIGLVTERTAITVRVNPEDFRVMNDILPELKTIFPDLGPVKIDPDQTVERGGIMAATRESEVDMRLATRLATFEEAILGYSGKAAVAPWSAIPPEAIEEYKRQNQESPYSLQADMDPPASQPSNGEQLHAANPAQNATAAVQEEPPHIPEAAQNGEPPEGSSQEKAEHVQSAEPPPPGAAAEQQSQ